MDSQVQALGTYADESKRDELIHALRQALGSDEMETIEVEDEDEPTEDVYPEVAKEEVELTEKKEELKDEPKEELKEERYTDAGSPEYDMTQGPDETTQENDEDARAREYEMKKQSMSRSRSRRRRRRSRSRRRRRRSPSVDDDTVYAMGRVMVAMLKGKKLRR